MPIRARAIVSDPRNHGKSVTQRQITPEEIPGYHSGVNGARWLHNGALSAQTRRTHSQDILEEMLA
eukprot:5056545-Prymnesium_polylepis.1